MTIDPLALVLAALGGLGLGVLHFGGLWWQVRLFEERRRPLLLVGLMAARLALLAGGLALAALAGALPLLVAALGVLAGRFVVMRRVPRVTP